MNVLRSAFAKLFRRKPREVERPPFDLVPVRELPPHIRRRLEKKAGQKFPSHGLVAIPTGFLKDAVRDIDRRRRRWKDDRLLLISGGYSGNSHQRRIQRRAEARFHLRTAEQVSRGLGSPAGGARGPVSD